jgi:hypothetical protein
MLAAGAAAPEGATAYAHDSRFLFTVSAAFYRFALRCELASKQKTGDFSPGDLAYSALTFRHELAPSIPIRGDATNGSGS